MKDLKTKIEALLKDENNLLYLELKKNKEEQAIHVTNYSKAYDYIHGQGEYSDDVPLVMRQLAYNEGFKHGWRTLINLLIEASKPDQHNTISQTIIMHRNVHACVLTTYIKEISPTNSEGV